MIDKTVVNEHWNDDRYYGGTGITNLSGDDILIAMEAIREYNDPDIWLHREPFDSTQCKFTNGWWSLHSNIDNLSAFWDLFRDIEESLVQ